MKYLLLSIFVFNVCSQVFSDNEDELNISFYGKSGKTHIRPSVKPTEQTPEELEPELESTSESIRETTTKLATPKPEHWWTRSTTRRMTPHSKPETTATLTTTTPKSEPEYEITITITKTTTTTTVRPKTEPERTTVKITTTEKPRPKQEPTVITINTITTTSRGPNPETEWTIRTTTNTTRKPKSKTESNRYPVVTPDPSILPPECLTMKCKAGYRCDCIHPCPATCNQPKRKPCPHKTGVSFCVAGCVCDNGFLLTENGTCIPVHNCPNHQPNGQIVCDQICTDGKQCNCEDPCPPTCEDPDPTPCSTLQCNPGCYPVCKKGYVLDRRGGECIPLQYCPNRQCISQSCAKHENEVYYECSTKYCNRTCDSPNVWCSGQCIRPGNLDCKPGYFRDMRTGRCVLHQQCNQPVVCGRRDEIFYDCDTRLCQRTCQRPNPICPAICKQPGNCDCSPGLVRDVKTCRCVDKNESTCISQRISDD